MSKITKFTHQELENFKAYEEVRAGGAYNMFDPRARQLTGLSRADYGFVMDNYSALKAQIKKNAHTAGIEEWK
jgi:hypothetical protein